VLQGKPRSLSSNLCLLVAYEPLSDLSQSAPVPKREVVGDQEPGAGHNLALTVDTALPSGQGPRALEEDLSGGVALEEEDGEGFKASEEPAPAEEPVPARGGEAVSTVDDEVRAAGEVFPRPEASGPTGGAAHMDDGGALGNLDDISVLLAVGDVVWGPGEDLSRIQAPDLTGGAALGGSAEAGEGSRAIMLEVEGAGGAALPPAYGAAPGGAEPEPEPLAGGDDPHLGPEGAAIAAGGGEEPVPVAAQAPNPEVAADQGPIVWGWLPGRGHQGTRWVQGVSWMLSAGVYVVGRQG
jgi:hypothetical protein